MINSLANHRFLRLIFFLIMGLLLVSALLLVFQALPGRAQDPQPESSAPQSGDAGPHTCTISNIAVFPTRIHVKCTTPAVVGSSNIYFFAASGAVADAVTTNRFLTLLNTAYALGKPVYVYYHTSTSLNPTGCLTHDCRGIDWIYLVP